MGGFYSDTKSTICSHYKEIDAMTVKQIKEKVSLSLELYRQEHELTLDELAGRIGVSSMQVSRWLKKLYKPLPLAMAKMHELKIL